jgi:hypothetical protein
VTGVEFARTRAHEAPRLALRPEEAAESLGVSRDYSDAHIAPELRFVRRSRLKLFPIVELEGWLYREAARALEGSA